MGESIHLLSNPGACLPSSAQPDGGPLHPARQDMPQKGVQRPLKMAWELEGNRKCCRLFICLPLAAGRKLQEPNRKGWPDLTTRRRRACPWALGGDATCRGGFVRSNKCTSPARMPTVGEAVHVWGKGDNPT